MQNTTMPDHSGRGSVFAGDWHYQTKRLKRPLSLHFKNQNLTVASQSCPQRYAANDFLAIKPERLSPHALAAASILRNTLDGKVIFTRSALSESSARST